MIQGRPSINNYKIDLWTIQKCVFDTLILCFKGDFYFLWWVYCIRSKHKEGWGSREQQSLLEVFPVLGTIDLRPHSHKMFQKSLDTGDKIRVYDAFDARAVNTIVSTESSLTRILKENGNNRDAIYSKITHLLELPAFPGYKCHLTSRHEFHQIWKQLRESSSRHKQRQERRR